MGLGWQDHVFHARAHRDRLHEERAAPAVVLAEAFAQVAPGEGGGGFGAGARVRLADGAGDVAEAERVGAGEAARVDLGGVGEGAEGGAPRLGADGVAGAVEDDRRGGAAGRALDARGVEVHEQGDGYADVGEAPGELDGVLVAALEGDHRAPPVGDAAGVRGAGRVDAAGRQPQEALSTAGGDGAGGLVASRAGLAAEEQEALAAAREARELSAGVGVEHERFEGRLGREVAVPLGGGWGGDAAVGERQPARGADAGDRQGPGGPAPAGEALGEPHPLEPLEGLEQVRRAVDHLGDEPDGDAVLVHDVEVLEVDPLARSAQGQEQREDLRLVLVEHQAREDRGEADVVARTPERPAGQGDRFGVGARADRVHCARP